MVHPCDKLCGNKTASGYCATTACINPQYSNLGTAQYGQGVQKRIITNADRIRSMTDEELAEWIKCLIIDESLRRCDTRGVWTKAEIAGGEIVPWLDWLKQEADE